MSSSALGLPISSFRHGMILWEVQRLQAASETEALAVRLAQARLQEDRLQEEGAENGANLGNTSSSFSVDLFALPSPAMLNLASDDE